MDQPISLPSKLAFDLLYWLDVLAETNDDPEITETIIALAHHIEGRNQCQNVPAT
jgi:hypothetical protein